MNMKRITAIVISAAFVLYLGSYTVLSVKGQYVPFAWGIAWVKWYGWAPCGFVSGPEGIKQRRVLQFLYCPLWLIDCRLIHTSDKALDGKYPINTKLDTELQEWEKWYKQNHAVEPDSAPDGARGSP